MSNHQATITLLKELTGQKNVLTIPRAFIKYMDGSIPGALFLSQLLYWSDRGSSEWVHKTYDEWFDEIAVSKYEARKAAQLLEDRGILQVQVRRVKQSKGLGDKAMHYLLDVEEMAESIVKFLTLQSQISGDAKAKIERSSISTKITAETTLSEATPADRKTSRSKPSDFDRTAADRLRSVVSTVAKVQRNSRAGQWAESIRKVRELDGYTEEDIKLTLCWLREHVGETYCPVVRSGTAFRSKFIRLHELASKGADCNGNGNRANGHNRMDEVFDKILNGD